MSLELTIISVAIILVLDFDSVVEMKSIRSILLIFEVFMISRVCKCNSLCNLYSAKILVVLYRDDGYYVAHFNVYRYFDALFFQIQFSETMILSDLFVFC